MFNTVTSKLLNQKYLVNFIIIIFIINFFFLGLYKNDFAPISKFTNFDKRPTVFCIILTNPKNFLSKTLIVNNTWAKDCDEHKFVSVIPEFYLKLSYKNRTVSNGYSIEVDNPYNLLQPSQYKEENYKRLTTKIYRTLIDIYTNYNGYDWYLKADDDTYIFMDHLKEFLNGKNPSEPATYGFNLKNFLSGGAGYVISNKALNLIASNIIKDDKFCPNTGAEDVNIADCFKKLNVLRGKSEDHMGRERFHPYNISDTLRGTYYSWLWKMTLNPIKKGEMSSSNKTISFHYMSPEEILKTHTVWTNYKDMLKENKTLDFQEYVLNKFQ